MHKKIPSSYIYPLNAPSAKALAALVSAMTIAIYAPDMAIIVPMAAIINIDIIFYDYSFRIPKMILKVRIK